MKKHPVVNCTAGLALGNKCELVLDIGNAAGDTTLARIAAGRISLEGIELGYRGIPTASVATGSPVAADAGKMVRATAGVTIPNSVFASTDVLTIYNTTAGNITITASITTLRLAGTASTGARTLAQKGIATVFFISGTEAVISGTGLT